MRGAGASLLWPRSPALMVKARVVLRRRSPADLSGQRSQAPRPGVKLRWKEVRGAFRRRSGPLPGGHPLGPLHCYPLPDWHNRSRETPGAPAWASLKAPGEGRAPGVRSGTGLAMPQGLINNDKIGDPQGRAPRHPRPIQPMAERDPTHRQRKNPLSLNRSIFSNIFLSHTKNPFSLHCLPFHPLFLQPRVGFVCVCVFFFFKQSIFARS